MIPELIPVEHSVVVVGPPGCGKGTIGKIASNQGYHVVGISKPLQKMADEKIKARIAEGYLIPDNLVHAVIGKVTPAPDQAQKLYFDGAARTREQARMLLRMLFQQYQHAVVIIHVKTDREVAEYRMRHRGRSDDTPEIIHRRLNIYEDNFPQVEAYLRKHCSNSYYTINGNQSSEYVLSEFLTTLKTEGQRLTLQISRCMFS